MATPIGDLRESVRSELALDEPRRRRRTTRLLGLAAATSALLCALGAAPAVAQGPYRQELIPGFTTFAVSGISSPDLVDLDGDGDLDAVVGTSYGTLRYFANTGSSSIPAFLDATGSDSPFSGIDVGTSSSPELVDLDGDGDLDAVVGATNGTLRYFRNSGSSAAPSFLEVTGTANPFAGIDVGSASTPELVDIDGDDDLDAIVGDTGGVFRYFRNSGSSAAPSFLEVTGTANPFTGIDVGSASTVELVDLDADGDLDAILGEDSFDALQYYVNTGSSTAPAFLEATGTANPLGSIAATGFRSIELVDLDADGDLDAIAGDVYGTLEYHVNTGSSVAPAFLEAIGTDNPLAGTDVGRNSSPDLVDLDGDGDLDAVVGDLAGTLRYFASTGSSAAPAFLEVVGTDSPFADIDVGAYSSPELVDLDGDGDLDALVGETFGTLRYFRNTGSSTAPSFLEATGIDNPFDGIDVGFRNSPELVDLDGDGDRDAIAGEDGGTLGYFRNTGGSAAPAFLEVTGSNNPFTGIDVGGYSSPELVDLDDDGDLDAVVGAGYGTLRYFRNSGSSAAPTFLEVTGSNNPAPAIAVRYSSPELVDLDGDGDLDALVGEMGGKLIFFRSLANDIFADGFESGDTSRWSAAVPP